MKTIRSIFLLCSAIALSVLPRISLSQTITIDSISATHFCAGDPVSVTFTVTGTWDHKNAFTLQLSDDSGHFTKSFQNLGSVADTAPGTFTIVSSIPANMNSRVFSVRQILSSHDTVVWRHDSLGWPPHDSLHQAILQIRDTTYDTTLASRYRFRVIGAYPYTVSADNGTDLVIGVMPTHFAFNRGSGKEAGIGVPKNFAIAPLQSLNLFHDSIFCSFGDGASPSTATCYGLYFTNHALLNQTTTYSTSGLKTVTVTIVAPGGCSVTDTQRVYVYDCSSPVVPRDAIVVSNDTSLAAWDYDSLGNIDPFRLRPRTFWVNPGVTVYERPLTMNDPSVDTIFAETGATVKGGSGNIVYLKQGASAMVDRTGIVIYADGASVKPNDAESSPELQCSGLSFDYSYAPPNSIMHINEAVASEAIATVHIDVSPNPTTGIVTVEGVPSHARIHVVNVLGEVVQEAPKAIESRLSLDFSKLPAGTYYLRLTSNSGVVTKKIVRE